MSTMKQSLFSQHVICDRINLFSFEPYDKNALALITYIYGKINAHHFFNINYKNILEIIVVDVKGTQYNL